MVFVNPWHGHDKPSKLNSLQRNVARLRLYCEGQKQQQEFNNILVIHGGNAKLHTSLQKCPHPLKGNTLPVSFSGVFPYSFLRKDSSKPVGFAIEYLEIFAEKFEYPKKFVLTVGPSLVRFFICIDILSNLWDVCEVMFFEFVSKSLP